MNKFYSSKAFQFFAIITMASLCLLLDTLTKVHFHKIELPKNSPEYNAKGIEGSVYDKSGKLLYDLKSAYAWQYPDDTRVYLKKLHIYMYDQSSDALKYQVDSDDGWINYSKKIGFLGKGTVVTINNSDQHKVIKIYGSDINLDMNKNTISSNQEVKAIQDKNAVYSQGFVYDHDKQFLTLNSKVRVIYGQNFK